MFRAYESLPYIDCFGKNGAQINIIERVNIMLCGDVNVNVCKIV